MTVSVVKRGSSLYASDEGIDDFFGRAAALSGDGSVLAVGAPEQDDVGAGTITNSGCVYIYDWSGSAWVARATPVYCPDFTAGNQFGYSVALSSDGLVLAVGAPFQGSNAGYVYVFDWSGSAWVERGSGFTHASDPDAPYQFGLTVSLSGDGAILVVGEPEHSDTGVNATYQIGCAYVYDWSGTAYVQRGSKLVSSGAASATADVFYGYSVAISADGLVLAVGCLTENASQGTVYVYDWSGGAWVLRGSAPVSSPAPTKYGFGQAVCISADGTWMLGSSYELGVEVLAYVLKWSGSAWGLEATVPLTSVYPVQPEGFALASGAAVMTLGDPYADGLSVVRAGLLDIFDIGLPVTGTPVAPTLLNVISGTAYIGTPSAPTDLTVNWDTGTPAAPTQLIVTATGQPECPTALAVVDLSQHWPLFSAAVVIDGVDVSSRIKGAISVEAEEGAARVAEFVILPEPGVIEPLDYVGATVSIDYIQVIGGVDVARRMFTGRIDTPHFDPITSQLRFECVDDMQNRVAALDRAVIDSLVGGKYTEAVQGEILDNWDYAQARLSTVAASLDAGPSGGLRVTPWELDTSWATFDESSLIYPLSTLSFPQRSTLINKVDIEFDYRYPRLRQRYGNIAWSGTLIDMVPNGYQYPTQQDILGAAGGTGWEVVTGVFYPAPAAIAHSSGGFIYPPDDAIDLAILYMAQRHSQTVTETFALTVTADESVDANGELPHSLRGALASEFDGGAWESALDVAPLMPTGGDMDYAPDAPRADADYAIETLLDQARVKILGSHRSARVGNAIVCNPDMDLDKRVTISTAMLAAAGKVVRVHHVIDLEAGSATTEFEIACFGVGGAGIITPDTLAAPSPPAEAAETQSWGSELPVLMCNTFGVTTYAEILMGLLLNPPETITVEDVPGEGTVSYANPYYVAGGYPVTGFRVQMPGVVDEDRNPIDKSVASSYSIVIPSDTITVTVPA